MYFICCQPTATGRGLVFSSALYFLRLDACRQLGGLSFRFDGKTGVLPSMESALKRPHVLVTLFLEFLHQTGAGGFVWSSAVRDGGSIFWDSAQVLVEIVRLYADGSWKHGVGFRPSLRIANVDQREVFSCIYSFFQFVDCDSWSIRHSDSSE